MHWGVSTSNSSSVEENDKGQFKIIIDWLHRKFYKLHSSERARKQ